MFTGESGEQGERWRKGKGKVGETFALSLASPLQQNCPNEPCLGLGTDLRRRRNSLFSADFRRIPWTVGCLLQSTILISGLAWKKIGKILLNPHFVSLVCLYWNLKPWVWGNVCSFMWACSTLNVRVLINKLIYCFPREESSWQFASALKFPRGLFGLSKLFDVHRYFVACFSDLPFVSFCWLFRASFQDW